MILIQHRNIKKAADIWADGLVEFLSADKISCYKHSFDDLCQKEEYRTVTDDKKSETWTLISDFLSVRSNFIGDENFLQEKVKYHEKNIFNHPLQNPIKEVFKQIYKEFSAKIAYKIFEFLKIRTCPYCNRHYTFTINSKRGKFKTRPEFDHFYNKKTYPFLAVTFFNLVPSCKECNQGKLTNECGVNPYFNKFTSKFIIAKPNAVKIKDKDLKELNANEIFKISTENDFSVDFKCSGDDAVNLAEEKNIESLGLRHSYNEHRDYVMEIVDKVAAYNVLARKGIASRFQGLCHNESDVFNLIFGKYLSDAEHQKRPLSKLTADILDQLEIHPRR